MVDVFVPRLSVVVPFLDNSRSLNTFGVLPSRATLKASKFIMKRNLLLLSLAFLLLPPLRLSAQTKSQDATPPVMHSAYGEKLRIPGVPNTGKINEHLYRGAQPRELGLAELKKLGITTVVDLRSEDPEKLAWERKLVESLGMRFVHIPVSGWSPPANEQVAKFLSLFRDNSEQRIFVHCHFGDDRTGPMGAGNGGAFSAMPINGPALPITGSAAFITGAGAGVGVGCSPGGRPAVAMARRTPVSGSRTARPQRRRATEA